MKYLKLILIILLTLFFTSVTCAGDGSKGIQELRYAIDYEMQKVRYIPPLDKDEVIDRGKIIRALNKFNKVGFQPVISILPEGVSYNVGPVVISADRRYVRVGLTPFFSNIGRVDTFTFGR